MLSGTPIEKVLAGLAAVRKDGRGWKALCPAHADKTPSLSVSEGADGRVLLTCRSHACTAEQIAGALGLTIRDLFTKDGTGPAPMPTNAARPTEDLDQLAAWHARCVARLEAQLTPDAGDAAMLLEERFGLDVDLAVEAGIGVTDGTGTRPPFLGRGWNNQPRLVLPFWSPDGRLTCVQGRHLDPNDKGRWDAPAGEGWGRVGCFGLDLDGPLIVCEGPTDAIAALAGGVAAIAIRGASLAAGVADVVTMWAAGRPAVFVAGDGDAAGTKFTTQLVTALNAAGTPAGRLDVGDTDLADRCQEAGPTWPTVLTELVAAPLSKCESPDRPRIVVAGRPLRDITADVTGRLVTCNEPPVLYHRGGAMTWVREDENGRPIVEPVGVTQLRHRVTHLADTGRHGKDDWVHTVVPLDVAQDVLAVPGHHWPALEAVAETPTVRPDGTVHQAAGYDRQLRLLHHPAPGLIVPTVADNPSDDDVERAVKLLSELICDFPFETAADRANALGLLLTPVVRHAIPGQVPLGLIDAPEPGTGKGLLANVVAVVHTGRAAAARPLADRDDEVRKAITSILWEGPTIVVLDNVDQAIGSPSLAAMLTTSEWSDRILGRSETVTIANRATWVATGNNLTVAGDIARRCYRIRLDARQAKPWARTDFAHTDLLGWALDNRGELIAALLTLARSWWAAGQPAADTPTIGGFTPWARTIGGILAHAGVGGFLANLDLFMASADVEADTWEAFLMALLDHFKSRTFTVHEVVQDVRSDYTVTRETVPPELADHIDKTGFAKRVGQAFRRRAGRRHGAGQLAVLDAGRTRSKIAMWTVVAYQPDQAVTSPVADPGSDEELFAGWDAHLPENERGVTRGSSTAETIESGELLPLNNPANPATVDQSAGLRGFAGFSPSPAHADAGAHPRAGAHTPTPAGSPEPRETLQPRADETDNDGWEDA